MASRIFISRVDVASSVMCAPRYLKSFTRPKSVVPILINMSTGVYFADVVVTLLFSALISMPNSRDVLSRRSVISYSSSVLSAIRSISSANFVVDINSIVCRFVTLRQTTSTDPSKSSSACVIICSRKRLNKHGDNRLLCRTPTVVRKHRPMSPSHKTPQLV